MDYVPPFELVKGLVQVGIKKARLSVKDMLLRGFLSGVFLGYATSLAFTVSYGFSGGAVNLVSAVVFPVGFAMIVLLGLELVTGNFALVPMAIINEKLRIRDLFHNWSWVFISNLVGSIFFGVLMAIAITKGFTSTHHPLAERIIEVASLKTIAYQEASFNGWVAAFVKGILCNWMVTLGTVLGYVSSSTSGKIFALWLPIMTFFGLGLLTVSEQVNYLFLKTPTYHNG